MIYLLRGDERKEKIELLVSLTSLTSENTIDAMIDYFCRGNTEKQAADMNNVSVSNLNRAISKLNAVAEIYEKLRLIESVK